VIVGQEPTFFPNGESYNYKVTAEFHYGMSRPPAKFRFPGPDYQSSTVSATAASQYSFTLAALFSSPHPI
jgi:hypothetical protein